VAEFQYEMGTDDHTSDDGKFVELPYQGQSGADPQVVNVLLDGGDEQVLVPATVITQAGAVLTIVRDSPTA
jgi:hypothetical protein